jgi:hypothetical protein
VKPQARARGLGPQGETPQLERSHPLEVDVVVTPSTVHVHAGDFALSHEISETCSAIALYVSHPMGPVKEENPATNETATD